MSHKLLHAHLKPEADIQQLVVTKEEDDPLSLDQGDPPEPPHIKKEQEEVWTGREQLQGLDQADIIKFTFFPVAVKSEEEDEEEDEEKPQCSQLQQRQTEDMKPEADGEDCGGPEPDRDSDPDHHDETLDFSDPETDDSDDWKKSSGPQSGNPGCDPGEKLFSCSECGKRFNHSANLKRHMRTHTGEKPFSCSVCGKEFAQSSTLTLHLRVHTGEKPFACSVCQTSFSLRNNLYTHMRMHTGEKPFSCSVCGKSFTQSSSLTSHLRVHTGEKPFTCSVCQTGFSDRGTLFRHRSVHTTEKQFSCSVCGKEFRQKGHMIRHMGLHTGEKPYSCDVCDRRFTRLYTLRNHQCVGGQSSQQTEADGEDSDEPEPDGLFNPDTHEETSHFSEVCDEILISRNTSVVESSCRDAR